MSDFTKEDRPFGEKVERRGHELKEDAKEKGKEIKEDLKGAARRVEGVLTNDPEKKREHEPSSIEKAGQKIKEKTEEWKDDSKGVKEDLKGAARRAEGEITGDEALKREHEPSMLEKAGEAISNAAEYVRDTAYAGAEKIGLVKEGDH